MARRKAGPDLPAPWLRSLRFEDPLCEATDRYPFTVPWLVDGFELGFDQPVTILIGENGSGKSTLIEAIAAVVGFPVTGGGAWSGAAAKAGPATGSAALARLLRPGWLPKVGQGWFLRAESFASVAEEITGDYLDVSHGEGFANLVMDRMTGKGIFILDEPEAALSPKRQTELLGFLASIQADADAQVIMATHSPLLMAVPGASLVRLSHRGVSRVELRDTDHFRLYQSFAQDPEAFVDAVLTGEVDTLF